MSGRRRIGGRSFFSLLLRCHFWRRAPHLASVTAGLA